ncbi:YhgE/Pip family protein [Naasia lichenicola]|uniref:YhgE/Pip family protein n=1 Tax=Naasia lichenicola TaxID=2565933 RepID=UPI00130D7BB6|nr:YhgE/Pip family protein [Naasia lichenicola]
MSLTPRSSSSTTAVVATSPSVLAAPKRRRPLALVALIAVPLIVVGLFAGALAAVGQDDSRIPAAIVNSDELITQTAADGTETQVLAGRLLVTALTGTDSDDPAASTFDWQISSADDAAAKLKSGDVYAVLTIPSTFSKSITSLSSDDPVRAQLTLETDDAHGYVTGPLTDAVGDGLAAIFGDQISQQYISGLLGGTATLGSALTDASGGATQLADGATALGAGLGTLQSGAAAAATGAQTFTDGLSDYTDGVDQLSSGIGELSSGLDQLSSSSSGLQQLPAGVSQYTGGVSQSAQGLAQLLAAYQAGQLTDAQVVASLPAISAGLDQLAAGGSSLVAGAQGAASVQSAIGGIADGADQLADGAEQLSDGSAPLVSGAQRITDGIGQLASGAGQSASGADSLAAGATTLASGLSDGAAQIPTYTDEQKTQAADVASSPITLTAVRSNEVSEIPQIVSTLLVPAGLWIGALAVFLAFGALSRRVLASTASSGRIALRTLARAAVLAAGQAVLLVLLLHAVIGVPWGSIGATLPFALLIAVVFSAIHALLSVAFGRWGLIVSLVLLALQLTATGGLYPIELLSKPFQTISPLLPVTSAVNGMQAIVTGADASAVFAACTGLILWGLFSALLVVVVVSRRRSARALGIVATA